MNRLGKTIFFAKNHNHAHFIVDRFDKAYAHPKGGFCRVIHHLADRGVMGPLALYEPPFTGLNPLGATGVFGPDGPTEVVQMREDVRRRAAVSANTIFTDQVAGAVTQAQGSTNAAVKSWTGLACACGSCRRCSEPQRGDQTGHHAGFLKARPMLVRRRGPSPRFRNTVSKPGQYALPLPSRRSWP